MNVGIVIGRFQVDNLHLGHRFLINTALQNHHRVIVLIGCAPIAGSRHDPLDYITRERMIRREFPDVTTLAIHDHPSDVEWSKQVDGLIKLVVPNVSDAHIYGGRDSFIPHYHGAHKTVELDANIQYNSGATQRKEIGKVVRSSDDFRAGIIYSTQNSWPYVKMCTDIALVKRDYTWVANEKKPCHMVLLGRKKEHTKWQLPGGMVDPTDRSLEECAARELAEETGITESSAMKYVSSHFIDDWRFKKLEEVKILSALFYSEYITGEVKAADDLCEVEWVYLTDSPAIVTDTSRCLIDSLINYLTTNT